MKTYNEWTKSGLPASKFLSPGDLVCDDIVEYFLCVLPPVTWKDNIIQMGEAYNFNEKGQTQYLTVEKINGHWTYTGIKPKPQKQIPVPQIQLNSRSTRRQIRHNRAIKSAGRNYGNNKPRYN